MQQKTNSYGLPQTLSVFFALVLLLFACGDRALTTLKLTKLAKLVDHEPKVSAC